MFEILVDIRLFLSVPLIRRCASDMGMSLNFGKGGEIRLLRVLLGCVASDGWDFKQSLLGSVFCSMFTTSFSLLSPLGERITFNAFVPKKNTFK